MYCKAVKFYYVINVFILENVLKIVFFVNIVIDYVNFGVYYILVFENVISNVGNCYYYFIGNFILNVLGVYVFDV